MAIFRLKQNKKEISFDGLPEGTLKQAIKNLQSTMEKQLSSLQCETHKAEPVVFLQIEGIKVMLAGFGACCKEFGSKVREGLHLPGDIMDPNVTLTTRIFSYTHKQ